jgi:hypothetical protein
MESDTKGQRRMKNVALSNSRRSERGRVGRRRMAQLSAASAAVDGAYVTFLIYAGFRSRRAYEVVEYILGEREKKIKNCLSKECLWGSRTPQHL